jgi:hypothetical protein
LRAESRAEPILDAGHFGRQQRAGIGTARKDKRNGKNLAAQFFQRKPFTILLGERELRRRLNLWQGLSIGSTRANSKQENNRYDGKNLCPGVHCNT